MIGAIIGDIVGSRFEWHNIKSKNFELFSKECEYTDDSVMTLAVAKSIIECNNNIENLSNCAIQNFQELGRSYPNRGYGGFFRSWIYSEDPQPYNSYGNGSAMRVSPCGFAANTLEEAVELADRVTSVTHNHPDGMCGAESVAVAVYLAKTGKNKAEIKNYICKNYYDIDFTLDDIRNTYTFDASCQGTVPQAIQAFCESNSFEDAIRNAISIGGDSDTIAAITGGIAQAYYGIPNKLREKAISYLDDELLGVMNEFENKYMY